MRLWLVSVVLVAAQFLYDNATMQTVQLAPGFSLRWDWEHDNIAFSLNLGAPVYGNFDWVGIGLVEGAVKGMQGADIYSVVYSNGNYYLADRKAVGNARPPTDESQGGWNNLQLLDFMDDNMNATITFRRPLKTEDPEDMDIEPNTQYSVLYAWGQGELKYHGADQRGFTEVNFTMGPAMLAWAALLEVALLTVLV